MCGFLGLLFFRDLGDRFELLPQSTHSGERRGMGNFFEFFDREVKPQAFLFAFLCCGCLSFSHSGLMLGRGVVGAHFSSFSDWEWGIVGAFFCFCSMAWGNYGRFCFLIQKES